MAPQSYNPNQMDEIRSWDLATAAVATFTVYIFSLAFYRCFLHPLSRFPGPKLAASTSCYEAYFDVVQNGQYTFKIAELHRKYGPIIRISPHELHINDPDFYDTLYRQDTAYDKYSWSYNAFRVSGGTVTTSAHSVHKARRQPLAPFFSQTKVAAQQELIRRHIFKLRNRLIKLAKSGGVFNMGAAVTAFTRDVSNDFILDKSYNSLDREDFDVVQLQFSQGAGGIWRLTKFVRFVAPMLQSLPVSLITAIADKDTKEFFRHMVATQDDTKALMLQADSRTNDGKRRRNLVDEIMNAKLPPPEKEFRRVFDEITTTTGAGIETSGSVLRFILFHIFSNPKMIDRLRTELASVDAENQLDWKTLAQLPYLSAVLHEGLRLSPGIATRMARIPHHADIFYKEWRIPAGTPVGMTAIIIHTDESIWPEPQSFNPDRWLKDGILRRIDKGFAPFSKGTRNCLGQQPAWAEMYFVLADLIRHFDFSFQDASEEDFLTSSDQFSVGTRSRGNLKSTVNMHQSIDQELMLVIVSLISPSQGDA